MNLNDEILSREDHRFPRDLFVCCLTMRTGCAVLGHGRDAATAFREACWEAENLVAASRHVTQQSSYGGALVIGAKDVLPDHYIATDFQKAFAGRMVAEGAVRAATAAEQTSARVSRTHSLIVDRALGAVEASP